MKLYFHADATAIHYIFLCILSCYFLILSLSLSSSLSHKLVLQIPELEYLRLCIQNSLEPLDEYDTEKKTSSFNLKVPEEGNGIKTWSWGKRKNFKSGK